MIHTIGELYFSNISLYPEPKLVLLLAVCFFNCLDDYSAAFTEKASVNRLQERQCERDTYKCKQMMLRDKLASWRREKETKKTVQKKNAKGKELSDQL